MSQLVSERLCLFLGDSSMCGRHNRSRRIFDCREELDTNAPEGLMVVRANDITYWCQGFRRESRNVAPTFPQSCVLLWGGSDERGRERPQIPGERPAFLRWTGPPVQSSPRRLHREI